MEIDEAVGEEDLARLLEEGDVDEINRFIVSRSAVELTVLLFGASYNLVSKLLEVIGDDAVVHLAEVADLPLMLRLLNAGGRGFISKMQVGLSRGQYLRVYQMLPAHVRSIFKECALEAGNSRFIKDINFLERRESEAAGDVRPADNVEILSRMNAMKEEIASIGLRESGFRSANEALQLEIGKLKDQLRKQEEINSEQFQEKIEGKVSDFVREAQESLERKEKIFAGKSDKWGWVGHVAMGAAILSACGSLWYGAEQFDKASGTDKIEWLFFGYLLLKGLIVISLFAALARHCYTISNAYMHESLKRSDRMHAINFGKFYLEVYGNEVSQVDMKAAFENWNLDSDSAFVKMKTASLEPKVIGQVAQIFESLAKTSAAKNGKAGA